MPQHGSYLVRPQPKGPSEIPIPHGMAGRQDTTDDTAAEAGYCDRGRKHPRRSPADQEARRRRGPSIARASRSHARREWAHLRLPIPTWRSSRRRLGSVGEKAAFGSPDQTRSSATLFVGFLIPVPAWDDFPPAQLRRRSPSSLDQRKTPSSLSTSSSTGVATRA